MAQIICIHLRKGGSGKTTTAINLAVGLTKQNKSVLLVDLDNQANASHSLGITDTTKLKTITNVLADNIDIQSAIIKIGKLDLIPADSQLGELETTMASNPSAYAFTIANILKRVGESYDYIIIDTPPSESMLSLNGLVACNVAILPIQTHYLALHGLSMSLDFAKRVKEAYKVDFELKLLATMITKTLMYRTSIKHLKQNYGDILFKTVIPSSIKIPESQLVGQSIIDYQPKHKASLAYIGVAKELIKGKGK